MPSGDQLGPVTKARSAVSVTTERKNKSLEYNSLTPPRFPTKTSFPAKNPGFPVIYSTAPSQARSNACPKLGSLVFDSHKTPALAPERTDTRTSDWITSN